MRLSQRKESWDGGRRCQNRCELMRRQVPLLLLLPLLLFFSKPLMLPMLLSRQVYGSDSHCRFRMDWSLQVLLSRCLACDTRVSVCSAPTSLTYSSPPLRFSSLYVPCCWAQLGGWWHCV